MKLSKIFSKYLPIITFVFFYKSALSQNNTNTRTLNVVTIGKWTKPMNTISAPLIMGYGIVNREGWGEYSPNERIFYQDALPPFFQKTMVLDSLSGNRGIKWIFTGPREGVYIELLKDTFRFHRKYYNSYGFNVNKTIVPRFPQLEYNNLEVLLKGIIQSITVQINYKFELIVSVNDKAIVAEKIIEDIRRNQLHLTGTFGILKGSMLSPAPVTEKIKVNPSLTFQKMLGWGGIVVPTAYNELSEDGKQKWWDYITTYNLLCQREYPTGSLLKKDLSNWDSIKYAKAHYYGDNFPNGETSNFEYNKKIQELGGFVLFEFWDFPEWIRNNEDEYARAIVGYCNEAVSKTGKAPKIIGIQNELDMPQDKIVKFVTALRKALDVNGFSSCRLHMSNAPTIKNALKQAPKYINNKEVWEKIDYAATNMYDYQDYFFNPDGYDSILLRWNATIKTKPFLSTELCVNDSKYQTDSYRIAFAMGQLYAKNLSLTNAAFISYCWLLLNTEQPSFGASRALFVTSPENGYMPVASSNQLRVYGAFSRRIKEGMHRIEATCANNDVKAVAFIDKEKNITTMVILNRSVHPVQLEIDWPATAFTQMEITNAYSPNLIQSFNEGSITVQPGSIITLTNALLNKGN